MATEAPDTVAARTLRDRTRGLVLEPDDDGYEEARSVWNGMIDRRPAVIARCTGVADVMAAVKFAHPRRSEG